MILYLIKKMENERAGGEGTAGNRGFQVVLGNNNNVYWEYNKTKTPTTGSEVSKRTRSIGNYKPPDYENPNKIWT